MLFSLPACAKQPQPEPSLRLIVGFTSSEQHDQALQNKAATLASWQAACSAGDIQFIRSLSGRSWVVELKGASETTIEKLQQLPDVQYVEKDQIIQVSPVERYPVRVH